MKNLIILLAFRVLEKNRSWTPEKNSMRLQIMEKAFHNWCYNEGYEIYKKRQFEKGVAGFVKCPDCQGIYLSNEVQPHTGLCGYCNPPF